MTTHRREIPRVPGFNGGSVEEYKTRYGYDGVRFKSESGRTHPLGVRSVVEAAMLPTVLSAMASTPEGRAKMREALGDPSDGSSAHEAEIARCTELAGQVLRLQEQLRQGQLRICDLQKDLEDARAARPRFGRVMASEWVPGEPEPRYGGIDPLSAAFLRGRAQKATTIDDDSGDWDKPATIRVDDTEVPEGSKATYSWTLERLDGGAYKPATIGFYGRRCPCNEGADDVPRHEPHCLHSGLHAALPLDEHGLSSLFQPTDTSPDPAMKPASAELTRKVVDDALRDAGCSIRVTDVTEDVRGGKRAVTVDGGVWSVPVLRLSDLTRVANVIATDRAAMERQRNRERERDAHAFPLLGVP